MVEWTPISEAFPLYAGEVLVTVGTPHTKPDNRHVGRAHYLGDGDWALGTMRLSSEKMGILAWAYINRIEPWDGDDT